MSLNTVLRYHDPTKHSLERYSRSLGYLDWANQPDPFRRYGGAPLVPLKLPGEVPEPTYDALFGASRLPAAPLDAESISRLFYYSLALSAWKQVRGPDGSIHSRWPLRVNPSSGNLHPTEGYLIAGPVPGLSEKPGVYHYAPREHGLEPRGTLEDDPLPPGALLVGLTSIHWREAWKYGERAFRYCQHDVGHALGAITISAATLGWSARLLDRYGTREIATLLGVDSQDGPEAEHVDCLLAIQASTEMNMATLPRAAEWLGIPNRLSESHHEWPIIDEVAAATESPGALPDGGIARPAPSALPDRGLAAHRIIRQRRSAVEMDGKTSISREEFFRMLRRVMPEAAPMPFAALGWHPTVSLALFVHRVDGLAPGLYLLCRHSSHEESLRRGLRTDLAWERAEGCPEDLPLWLLIPGDVRAVARTVSCHQQIASGGAFAVAMLAEFDATLSAGGPPMYPRMFWETGMIGQVLYLEAEAAGVRATGIGCFFDDAVHEILGIPDHAWQSLYHFTVGGPVEDTRVETADAYSNLRAATI